jgi:hypothetical protein
MEHCEYKFQQSKASMKPFLKIALFLFLLSYASPAASQQSLDSLSLLEQSNLYFSKGFEKRARETARHIGSALDYYSKVLGFKPEVTILVLSKEDWSRYTRFPMYGMPHYTNSKTLVVASSNNEFWNSFIPDMKALPPSLADEVRKAYRQADGSISMERFFDLLALHELGHAFHIQGGLKMQRKWMGELFCNIFLHTYIAEKAPDQLAALTVFPQMVVSAGTDGFNFTTLQQFEDNYNALGTKHPKNYGWYQCRLHVAAQKIYDAGGKDVILKLWNTLKSVDEVKGDAEFAELLRNRAHPSVADVVLKW